jgi:hypothetical protein
MINNINRIIQNYFLNNIPYLITITYIFLKFYKVFYFTKVILDQVPIFNSYQWPFSILRIMCKPYSDFWNGLFPKIKVFGTVFDISYLIGLEALNKLSKFLLILKYISLNYVKN